MPEMVQITLKELPVFQAYQLKSVEVIQTGATDRDILYGVPEQELGQPGDWVVIHPNLTRIWTDNNFQSNYRILELAKKG